MTKVLITGATGFIGRYLLPYLLKKCLTIRILVRQYSYDFQKEIEQHIGDLTQPESLLYAAQDVEIVFHLGGFAHAWKGADLEIKHDQINLIGTKNLLDECVRANVKKFIFFSSTKAVRDSKQCIDEQWTELPDTPYGNTKRKAEQLILSFGIKHNLPGCILRLSLVYGPSLKGNLQQMLQSIDKGFFLPIPPVHNYLSMVSVYDVCQAAWLASQNEKANGKIYFVTDEENYTTHLIYLLMRQALGLGKPFWYCPLWLFKLLAIIGDQLEYIFRRRLPFNTQAFNKLFSTSDYNSSLIREELGFKSQYSLSDLLPEIVKTYHLAKL